MNFEKARIYRTFSELLEKINFLTKQFRVRNEFMFYENLVLVGA